MTKARQQSLVKRYKLSAQWAWLLSVSGLCPLAPAADLPSLRSGLWEYTRTIQRSDQDWVPKDLSDRACENPSETLTKQNETFVKLGCTIATTQVTEDVYRVNADCPEKNGTKVASQSVITFADDSGYTSVIESEGPVAGKPVKFSERLTAKRIGDCGK